MEVVPGGDTCVVSEDSCGTESTCTKSVAAMERIMIQKYISSSDT